MYSGRQHQQNSHLGATFSPGGMDDYSMPEVVSPAPQRSAPEEFHEIQGKLQHMELGADTIRPTSVQSQPYSLADTLTHPGAGGRGGTPQANNSPFANGGSYSASKQASTGGGYGSGDAPSFSPFPKLSPRPPNVPPSDDEKLQILETAKSKVIASNDPEIQLTWAQDTLNFVEIAIQDETRNAADEQRPATPRIEHELKQEALNITSFLAEQHHPRAQFIKGTWLEFGKFGTRKDRMESYRCYARAAERGYARAEYRMGMQFEGSNDIQKAVQHYNRGVSANDAASSYRIGMMTLLGQHGQTLDISRGLELIKYSADNADENSPQGAYIYGMLLARELPQIAVPEYALAQNIQSARSYVEKAAFLGFAKAQTKLGRAYEHSELGCHFDAVLSLHYNNLAARQGDEDAEMAISKWFLSGQEGVFSKNEQMAFLYAKRAAKSGLATAEFAMGYFHEVGIHVSVDLKEAQRWYRKAADKGNKDAAARVEGISRSKTLSRKDHERLAVAKVKDARANDQQQQQPRTSSRMGGPNGAPIPMPQPTPTPHAPTYPPQGAAYPPAGAHYPPAGAYSSAGTPAYPSAGTQYGQGPANRVPSQPLGGGYPPQQAQYGAQGPPGGYAGYAGGRPSPAPAPGGYGNPGPGPQGPGARPPYQNNQYPPRTASTPQSQALGRRPMPAGPGAAQTPPADFGYQAPQHEQRPHYDYSATGYRPPPTSRPDYPSNPGSPVGGVPAAHKPLPGSNRPSPAPGRGAQASKPQGLPSQPSPAPSQAQKPLPVAKKPQKPMAQGPSTFDEMGVPKVKDKSDCVIM